MSNVLIVGCGYAGGTLARRLHAAGHHVVGWRRSALPAHEPYLVQSADVTNTESMPPLRAGLEYIFYMVGATHSTDEAYRDAYVRGVSNVLRAAHEQCPALKRFFFISSTGVYAQSEGEWVDEDSAAESAHFTGARLLEGESLVRDSGLPHTVVRFAGIYGPGRTRLIDNVRSGTAVRPATPRFLNLIHRDDCAGSLHHLMEHPNPRDLYLGVDHAPTDRGEILCWIAQHLGLPHPAVGEAGERNTGNKRCRNARLVGDGYGFRYPSFREGYLEIL